MYDHVIIAVFGVQHVGGLGQGVAVRGGCHVAGEAQRQNALRHKVQIHERRRRRRRRRRPRRRKASQTSRRRTRIATVGRPLFTKSNLISPLIQLKLIHFTIW